MHSEPISNSLCGDFFRYLKLSCMIISNKIIFNFEFIVCIIFKETQSIKWLNGPRRRKNFCKSFVKATKRFNGKMFHKKWAKCSNYREKHLCNANKSKEFFTKISTTFGPLIHLKNIMERILRINIDSKTSINGK